MEHELQILILEHDPADADRLMRELARQGLTFEARRVETREEFLGCLESRVPDLILSEHGAPPFTGFGALKLAQEKCPQVPFIFVTGCYDQGLVVEMFDSGAAGYVYKNRLTDLAPVMRQAQEEINLRSLAPVEEVIAEPGVTPNRPSAERASKESDVCLICSHCKKVRDEWGGWEDLSIYLHRHERATVTLALCPVCTERKPLTTPAEPSKMPRALPVPQRFIGPNPITRPRPSP